MKIFVGWPYDAVWVEHYVLPFIKSYGIEPVTGKDLQGKEIKGGVEERMKEVTTALLFLTRRGDPDAAGEYKTSDWVIDEIKHANSTRIPTIIEVREKGVSDYPNKLHPERQHMDYDPASPMKFMVELGEVLGRMVKERGVLPLKLKLTPKGAEHDFAGALKKRIMVGTGGYKCSYYIRRGATRIHGPIAVEIVLDDQSYYIHTEELPLSFFNSPDMYLQVEMAVDHETWLCYGVRPNVLEVQMESYKVLEQEARLKA